MWQCAVLGIWSHCLVSSELWHSTWSRQQVNVSPVIYGQGVVSPCPYACYGLDVVSSKPASAILLCHCSSHPKRNSLRACTLTCTTYPALPTPLPSTILCTQNIEGTISWQNGLQDFRDCVEVLQKKVCSTKTSACTPKKQPNKMGTFTHLCFCGNRNSCQ